MRFGSIEACAWTFVNVGDWIPIRIAVDHVGGDVGDGMKFGSARCECEERCEGGGRAKGSWRHVRKVLGDESVLDRRVGVGHKGARANASRSGRQKLECDGSCLRLFDQRRRRPRKMEAARRAKIPVEGSGMTANAISPIPRRSPPAPAPGCSKKDEVASTRT